MKPLEVERARELVLAEVTAPAAEPVAIEDCLDRVTAGLIVAAAPVPPFDNSAMDGFAVRAADAASGQPLRIVDESRAGSPAATRLGPGEAVRISTGAEIPAGADAVLQVEDAAEDRGEVSATVAPDPGAHLRPRGEDIEAGETLLDGATRIGPAELGLIAAAGLAKVPCAPRPRLALLTSGDELVAPGVALGPGQIYDVSRFVLPAQARRAGAEADFVGVLPDRREEITAPIERALDQDLVVVAGGVSVGPHDHVKAAFEELGVEQRFWRVALRPGGPTWFGVRELEERRTLVFGLPGNPVSTAVTFHLFVRAAILAGAGLDPDSDLAEAIFARDYAKPAGRAHYLRCRLQTVGEERQAVPTTERQGSNIVSSMLGADCLAVIPADRVGVSAGERVAVRLL